MSEFNEYQPPALFRDFEERVAAIVSQRCAPLMEALESYVAECVHWDATDNLAGSCAECQWAVDGLARFREQGGDGGR